MSIFTGAIDTETSRGQKLLRYAPLWLVCLGYALVRVRIFGQFAHPPGLHPLSLPQVLFSALALIAGYFTLLFWPIHLSALYEFHASTRLDGHVLAGGLAVIVSAIAFGFLWKRARPASFAILWLFITLAPVLDARWMGVYVMADRYLYLPSVGFCLVAGWGCAAVWRAASRRGRGWRTWRWRRAAWWRRFVWSASARACWIGESDVTIFRQALTTAPDDYRIHDGLGQAYWIRGDADDARREWLETLRLEPDSIQTLDSLGALYAQEQAL